MVKLGFIVSLIYILLGAYLLNLAFSFVTVPEMILGLEKWILVIAGIFLILGAWFFYKYNEHPGMY